MSTGKLSGNPLDAGDDRRVETRGIATKGLPGISVDPAWSAQRRRSSVSFNRNGLAQVTKRQPQMSFTAAAQSSALNLMKSRRDAATVAHLGF
jgi:hypothetical protein